MKLPLNLLKSRNDVAALVALIYSPEGLETFKQMADDTFNITWGELTTEDAHALLMLLGAAEQFNAIAQTDSDREVLDFVPPILIKGFSNAFDNLSPYRDLLLDIEAKQVAPLEAKIRAGKISFAHGQGVSMSIDQLNSLLTNAA